MSLGTGDDHVSQEHGLSLTAAAVGRKWPSACRDRVVGMGGKEFASLIPTQTGKPDNLSDLAYPATLLGRDPQVGAERS
jgi:hypothetical protein